MPKIRKIVNAAVIAAAYISLTVAFAPISYAGLQFRVSEALTILPFLAPYSTLGLFVGCFIANFLNPFGVNPLDVVFGSFATLLAGYLTSKAKNRYIAPLPPVIINGVVMGAVIAFTTAPKAFWPAFFIISLQVAFGELVVCYALGLPLLIAAEKVSIKKYLYPKG